jgi:hypothetical protein
LEFISMSSLLLMPAVSTLCVPKGTRQFFFFLHARLRFLIDFIASSRICAFCMKGIRNTLIVIKSTSSKYSNTVHVIHVRVSFDILLSHCQKTVRANLIPLFVLNIVYYVFKNEIPFFNVPLDTRSEP